MTKQDSRNKGRSIRSGEKNPMRGGTPASKATGTDSQSSNFPKTTNPKTVEKPGKVSYGPYGKGSSGKKKR